MGRVDHGDYGPTKCHRFQERARTSGLFPLNMTTCLFLFREPVDRAISHYYEFVPQRANMSAWHFFEMVGAERFVQATGGKAPQKSYLGPDQMANEVFGKCMIGVQERFDDFVKMLAKLGIASRPQSMPHAHAHKRAETLSQTKAMRQAMLPLLDADVQVWQRAQCQMNADYMELFPN